MSAMNNGTISGVAYQSIIIALIAGGILTIGVVSILWRRRSQRSWMSMRADANLPMGMDGLGMGTGLEGGAGGRKRKRLGKPPEVWDALIAPREEANGVRDEEQAPEIDADEKVEARTGWSGLRAEIGEDWHPTSIAIHEFTPSPARPPSGEHANLPPPPTLPPAYSAELTVLIAMPSPDRPITFSSPSGSRTDYSTNHTYVHPPLPPHIDAEDESLPDMCIATTSVPVSTSPDRAWERDEVERWVDDAQAARIAAGASGSASGARRTPARGGALITGIGAAAGDAGGVPGGANANGNGPGGDAHTDDDGREEQVGWAGRLGLPGVIRRGDMIARPRTPERDRRGDRRRRDRRELERERDLERGAEDGVDVESDPRARPNLFHLANMSHSMGVFRFGNVAGLPPVSGSTVHRQQNL